MAAVSLDSVRWDAIAPRRPETFKICIQEVTKMANAQLTLKSVIDVRPIMPRERHSLIFDTFHKLEPGQRFVLVNDHDPKPLYYQFEAEHRGIFGWDYLEKGPDVWRVVISRNP